MNWLFLICCQIFTEFWLYESQFPLSEWQNKRKALAIAELWQTHSHCPNNPFPPDGEKNLHHLIFRSLPLSVFFLETRSWYSPGWLPTGSDPPASSFLVLGLKVCTACLRETTSLHTYQPTFCSIFLNVLISSLWQSVSDVTLKEEVSETRTFLIFILFILTFNSYNYP